MNYVRELRNRAMAHNRARARVALSEARRDDLIREAHRAGKSSRDIATAVGLSFQRVAVIVARELDRPLRPTLHGAMERVLRDANGDWMPVHAIAREVYERELYHRKDRGVIHPAQVRARAARYPHLFEGSTDGTNRVRLRAAA
jgi:hypothetical protein